MIFFSGIMLMEDMKMILIKLSRLEKAIKKSYSGLSNPGFCLACGKAQQNCEPDAQHYTCTICGKNEVFGAEEILMQGRYSE